MAAMTMMRSMVMRMESAQEWMGDWVGARERTRKNLDAVRML